MTNGAKQCACCGLPIADGQKWVREKVYEPALVGDPSYLRYHADLFPGQEISCWEKHQLETDTARNNGYGRAA